MEKETKEKDKKKKKNKKRIVWLSLLAAVVIIVVLIVALNRKEVNFNTTRVENGKIDVTVMATGYIQPVEEVEVGTQVSGVIEKLYVDYNSHVKKGQLLAELDKSTLQEKVNQARSSLNSAQSDLLYARQTYDRTKKLHAVQAATDVALEEAVNRLAQAQTAVENAEATLSQAEVNLSYAYIYSPIDGVVLDRSVNSGQTVAASFNTPTLFTIAEDLTKMQVEADIDEADIGQVKVGQKAIFTVDSYSDDVFEGEVKEIRLQPTVTSNVVTYTVIIDAPNPYEKLFPGMTANITITVESANGLLVPLEAVNFRMTDEMMEKEEIDPSTIVSNNRTSQHVWVYENGKPVQKTIKTGINDGINYIVKPGLSEGDEVILSATIGKKKKETRSAIDSFMAGGSGRKPDK